MPRGGKRPGAGAPKGNLNALKHGRHSARLRQAHTLLMALVAIPQVRDAFALIARRDAQRRRRAARIARPILLSLARAHPQNNQLRRPLGQLARLLRQLENFYAQQSTAPASTRAHNNQPVPRGTLPTASGAAPAPAPAEQGRHGSSPAP